MDFPVPGGPMSSALCPPAAAISSARFTFSWPLTSAKSNSSSSLCSKIAAMSTFVGAILISPSRNCAASRRFWTGMTCKPATTAASAAFSAGTSTPIFPSAFARIATGNTPLQRPHRAGEREFADGDKIVELIGLDLFARRQHPERDGQIEARPLLFHVGGREVDGRAAHRKFVAGIGERGRHAVARFLHRGVRQADDDNQRVAPAGVDLDFDRKSFDAVERGGADLREHGILMAEIERNSNVYFQQGKEICRRPCSTTGSSRIPKLGEHAFPVRNSISGLQKPV